ncbi:MAG: acyltransferase domain-containing protein, partial [bacterium]|nr:acyltransferase domain-containing protein [bacterium]
LQVGRQAFEHRRAVVCRDVDDAIDVLGGGQPERLLTRRADPGERLPAFMFPGQGTQHVNMGRALYEHEPSFRAEVDRCCELLSPGLGVDLSRLLYPPAGEEEAACRQLEQTAFTQPALFVVEYALARLWMAWGVRPWAMIGHSLGEYVAACLADVLSLEDALALVTLRGRLVQELPPGAMLSVPLAAEALSAKLGPELALAAINGPERCVVSGPAAAVDELAAQLAGDGVETGRLRTSHAFHSAQMTVVEDHFLRRASAVEFREPRLPWVSCVTGRWIRPEEATDAGYWARQLSRPVRFADGLGELAGEEGAILLEVGPGRTLQSLARQHPATACHTLLGSLPE